MTNEPIKAEPTDVDTTAGNTAVDTIEGSQVAGFSIGKHLGKLIKTPISGLALIIYENYSKDTPPKQIQQKETLLPPGTLTYGEPASELDRMKQVMYQGIAEMRQEIVGFLVKNDLLDETDANREFERVAREAVAEAATWLNEPEKMTSKVQISRATADAESKFRTLLSAQGLVDESGFVGKR